MEQDRSTLNVDVRQYPAVVVDELGEVVAETVIELEVDRD